jgi:hypothetical protein
MTCIVGVVDKGGDYLIGNAGQMRYAQIVQYRLALPEPPQDAKDLNRFMFVDFNRALRTELEREAEPKREDHKVASGITLIATAGQLFSLWFEGSMETADAHGYLAIGSGSETAQGSLHATKGLSDPSKRLRMALDAASAHTAGVAPPYDFLSLPRG